MLSKYLVSGELKVVNVKRKSVWMTDSIFCKLYKEAQDKTTQIFGKQAGGHIAVGPYKAYVLRCLALHAANFPGDMAELGVYHGGSAYLLTQVVPQKTLHLFDTFTGIPEIDKEHDPKNIKGMFRSSSQKVKQLLENKDIHIYEGIFPSTITDTLRSKKFSFVHSDADIYLATLAACDFFYPRLVSGGIMVFDDYGYIGTPGARDAVDEFFADKIEMPIVFMPDQAVVIKI